MAPWLDDHLRSLPEAADGIGWEAVALVGIHCLIVPILVTLRVNTNARHAIKVDFQLCKERLYLIRPGNLAFNDYLAVYSQCRRVHYPGIDNAVHISDFLHLIAKPQRLGGGLGVSGELLAFGTAATINRKFHDDLRLNVFRRSFRRQTR